MPCSRSACPALLLLAACAGTPASKAGAPPVAPAARYHGGDAPQSRAADRVMVAIPSSAYIAGSTVEEREQAYQDFLTTSGRDSARKGGWFEHEEDRHRARLDGFRIDLTPVTNAAYAEFVADTGATPPRISQADWKKQGFVQDYDREVARFNWSDQGPPPERAQHPVVLVTWKEAADYCAWRGQLVGEPRRLPSEEELEKASRGPRGRIYPWGDDFDADKLNSAVTGPRDTVAVGSFPAGKSPYGVLGLAGNVFQWSSSSWPFGRGRKTVKGSAWDDYGGVGRGASRHGRRVWVRHAIVGFRCAAGA